MIIPNIPFIAVEIPKALVPGIAAAVREPAAKEEVIAEAPPIEAPQAETPPLDHQSIIETNSNFIDNTINKLLITLKEKNNENSLRFAESVFSFKKKEIDKFWNDLVDAFGTNVMDIFAMITIANNHVQAGAVISPMPVALWTEDNVNVITNATISIIYRYFYAYLKEFYERNIDSFMRYLDSKVKTSFIVSESPAGAAGYGLMVPNNPLGLRGRIISYSSNNAIRILYQTPIEVDEYIKGISSGMQWLAENFVNTVMHNCAKLYGMELASDKVDDTLIEQLSSNDICANTLAFTLAVAGTYNEIYRKAHSDSVPYQNIGIDVYTKYLLKYELMLKYHLIKNFSTLSKAVRFIESDQNIHEADEKDAVFYAISGENKATRVRYNAALIIYQLEQYNQDRKVNLSRSNENTTEEISVLNLISSCIAYDYHKRELGLL